MTRGEQGVWSTTSGPLDRLRPAGSGIRAKPKTLELLTAHKVRNTFHPTEGLHNFAVWRRYLVEIAPLLFRKDGRPH